MSVEYQVSKIDDTDMTRSEIAYKNFSSDGKNFLISGTDTTLTFTQAFSH